MPAAAAARTRTRRQAPPPRRISGPVRPRAGTVIAPPPLALRLGGAVHSIAEHRWLDRVIRGRAWIAILAVGLIGIVFMQVSMLRMNAGIGRDVDASAKLERENAAMRATLSELSSGDRIEAEAAKLGYVLPPAGSAHFLDARHFDPARALSSIQPPSHLTPLPLSVAGTTIAAGTAVLPATGVAPAPSTTAGTVAAPTGTTATATTTTTAQSTATTQTTAPAQSTTSQPSSQSAQSAPPPGTAGAAAAGTGTSSSDTGGAAATGG